MKEKYQDHHCLPVSIGGHDWPENIVRLIESDHTQVHKVLNLPYQKIRSFRLKTNHMVHRNSQEFIRELRKIHLAFFQNINMLPKKIQNQLRDSIRETTERLIREHNIELKKIQADARISEFNLTTRLSIIN